MGLWAHKRLRLGGCFALQTGPKCMGTTIRSSISSPSTSDNDPRLPYIWMYVCGMYTQTHT